MVSVFYKEYVPPSDNAGEHYKQIYASSKNFNEVEVYNDIISFYPEGGTFEVTGRQIKYDHGKPHVNVIMQRIDDGCLF